MTLKHGYTLSVMDRLTRNVVGWFRDDADGGVRWLREPLKDNETPSELTLERVSEIIAQTDIDAHTQWLVTDSQNRKISLPNHYQKRKRKGNYD